MYLEFAAGVFKKVQLYVTVFAGNSKRTPPDIRSFSNFYSVFTGSKENSARFVFNIFFRCGTVF